MTQETKLTEPVQVGLWYETKAGCITKIDFKGVGGLLKANNGLFYSEFGELSDPFHREHNLIRCLGADPFKQVQPEQIKCEACNGLGGHWWREACGSENGQQCDICGGFGMIDKNALVKCKQPTTPTQFERIFTAVLPEVMSYTMDGVSQIQAAIAYTQEAIKQLKEIEGA